MLENKYKAVNSVSAYLEEIISINATLDKSLPGHKETLLFRGQADSNYKLLPSVGRERKFSVDISILDEERNLIELAKYRLPVYFSGNMEPIELLALLQHYGIPTRLLDVTSNALAALYFACESCQNKKGEVVVFKNDEGAIVNYPIVNALADSYRFLKGTFNRIDDFYDKVKRQPYFLEHATIMNDGMEAQNWISQVCENPIFVFAPIRAERQRNQQGQYLLFPNSITKRNEFLYFDKVISPLSKENDCIAKLLIVKPEDKVKILHELKICGIDEAFLFPDSPDVVCRQIATDCRKRIKYD